MQEIVLDVYMKQQWTKKVGQEESKSKSWNKVEDKYNFGPETRK